MPTALQALKNDTRYSIRTLVKDRRFTVVVLATLALGIGMNTAIFSVVNAVLLRPLPYPEPDRLVWMAETGEVTNRFISYANFKDWRDQNRSFVGISTVRAWPMTLTGAGEPRGLTAQMVAADFFDVLGARPAIGRAFTAEDEATGALVTVVSHDFWRGTLGADPNAAGKQLMLDDKPFQILGVMPPAFAYQEPAALWVLVGGKWAAAAWNERDVRMAGYVIARRKPAVTLAQARADMSRISQRLTEQYPIANAGQHRIEMLCLDDSMTRSVRPALLILLGAVGLVLLICCANVANLSLARLSTRQKELSLRAALGASRSRIFLQLLAETIPLSLAGGLAGLLLASWSIHLLTRFEQQAIPRLEGLELDLRVLAFTFLISGLTGILSGIAPGLHVSKIDLNETLRSNSHTATQARGHGWATTLLVVEMALALIVLGGCGLMIRSLIHLLDSSPGFDPHAVVTMRIVSPTSRYGDKVQAYRLHQLLLERVSALPGVEHASISNNLPGVEDGWQTDIFPEGHARLRPGELINVDWSIVSRDYFDTMRILILRGRSFTDEELQKGSPVVLIDDHLASEFWPGGDALGKHILYDSPDKHEIIGIVKTVSMFGSEARPRIKIYTPLGRSSLNRTVLSIRTSVVEPLGIVESVSRQVREVDGDLAVADVATMEELLGRQVSPRRFSTALFTVFAVVALALAAVGVFGVASYSASQRTNEIGLRMALGASRSDILKMIMRQAMTRSFAGVLFGLGGAIALTRVMKSLLYRIDAADPATFAAAVILLVLLALVACYIPARRATRMDPLAGLRHD